MKKNIKKLTMIKKLSTTVNCQCQKKRYMATDSDRETKKNNVKITAICIYKGTKRIVIKQRIIINKTNKTNPK